MAQSALLFCSLFVACSASGDLALEDTDLFLQVSARQAVTCPTTAFCNEGFTPTIFECVGGTCQRIAPVTAAAVAPMDFALDAPAGTAPSAASTQAAPITPLIVAPGATAPAVAASATQLNWEPQPGATAPQATQEALSDAAEPLSTQEALSDAAEPLSTQEALLTGEVSQSPLLDLGVGSPCVTIGECDLGLVCAGTSGPIGTCESGGGVVGLTNLLINLVQEDYTLGDPAVPPVVDGPTEVSRAYAIIMLAAHDAFVLVSGDYKPKLPSAFLRRMREGQRAFNSSMVYRRSSRISRERLALGAMHAAALTVVKQLFTETDVIPILNAQMEIQTEGVPRAVVRLGVVIGNLWLAVRANDNSDLSQSDFNFTQGDNFTHQPDPNRPPGVEFNLGRNWGLVTPFLLDDVETDAFLGPPPEQGTPEFQKALDDVEELGRCEANFVIDGMNTSEVGVFWAYDGAVNIGVPIRNYLQIILLVPEFRKLPMAKQLRVITGSSVAMADAGITAWFWKYFYDYPRPVIGIRLLSNETWNPLGAPETNVPRDASIPLEPCFGINPNFPAYPSGHATFGTAAFNTAAMLLGEPAESLSVTFTSDEFNGVNVDAITGLPRRVLTKTFSLAEAVQANLVSRVFLGVHWLFDGTAGETLGNQIVERAVVEFRL